MVDDFVIRTRADRESLSAALTAALFAGRGAGWQQPSIKGQMRGHTFRIWASGPARTRLGPAYIARHVIFDGEVRSLSAGAEVRGHFGRRLLAIAPAAFGFAISIMFLLAVAEAAFRSGLDPSLIAPTVMAVAVAAVTAVTFSFQLAIGAHDRSAIVQFLEDVAQRL